MRLTNVQRAYAAGFFDGEGAVMIKVVTVQAGESIRLTVAAAQNTLPVLEMFKKWFGGGVYQGARCHQWKAHGPVAAAFLREVLPYLVVKQEASKNALHRWEAYVANKSRRISGG